ncbi:type VII secretion-associated protein [Prescottella subtropica]|uniref:type VII secretion-associated protein n=1 Tax=Prescottella subtropica TaxID=2545757 RepID=UPI0010F6D651|nr:type VII secretion-associated protein [Prescottella subtropica]
MTRVYLGAGAVWVAGPTGVVRVPDPAVRDCLDGIDDASTGDLLAAVLHRTLGQALGGTGFVPELTVLHPSHWGAPRRGVLEAAARHCTQHVTSTPVALAAPPPAPGACRVILECRELSTTATLVEDGGEHGPRLLACELASDVGALDLRDDPATVPTLAELVRAVAGDRRFDVVVAGEVDDGTLGILTGALGSTIVTVPPPALLAPTRPRTLPVERPAPWTDPVPRPAPRTTRRVLLAAVTAGAVVAGGAGVAAVVSFREPAGPSSAPVTAGQAADPLRNFTVGGASVTLPPPWEVQQSTGNRLDLVPRGAAGRRITVVATDVDDGTDRDTVAAALERKIAERGPDGPFGDFDPAADVGGRPGVTYVESPQDDSRVRWHVLVEDGVQVSVGCQYTGDGWELLAGDCAQAVRSIAVTPT